MKESRRGWAERSEGGVGGNQGVKEGWVEIKE